jgi:thiol-disulfide isomerase/thioredoxin
MTALIRALCLASLATLTPGGSAADEMRAAPPLAATLIDGTRFVLAEQAGKVVVVNFWATWCGPCREEMPAIDAFYRKHRGRGLEVVAISLDEPRDLAAVREVMREYRFPAALSTQAEYRGYGRIWRVPMTFVIDRQGRLRDDVTGGVLQVDATFLEQRVAPLLAH